MTAPWIKDRKTRLGEDEDRAAKLEATNPPNAKLDDKIVGYIVSYPKSGSTWTRYIIEYITGIVTVYEGNLHRGVPLPGYKADTTLWDEDTGVHKSVPFPVSHKISGETFRRLENLTKPHVDYPLSCQPGIQWRQERMNYSAGLILKKHFTPDIGRGNVAEGTFDGATQKLMLLLRDPRDALLRHQRSRPWASFKKNIEDYIKYPGEKTVIYYEELLKTPEKVILQIANFWDPKKSGEHQKVAEKFMKEYDKHVELSAATYRTFGKAAYQTQTLGLPNFGINAHHLGTGGLAGQDQRNKQLLDLCTDDEIAAILKPYR